MNAFSSGCAGTPYASRTPLAARSARGISAGVNRAWAMWRRSPPIRRSNHRRDDGRHRTRLAACPKRRGTRRRLAANARHMQAARCLAGVPVRALAAFPAAWIGACGRGSTNFAESSRSYMAAMHLAVAKVREDEDRRIHRALKGHCRLPLSSSKTRKYAITFEQVALP